MSLCDEHSRAWCPICPKPGRRCAQCHGPTDTTHAVCWACDEEPRGVAPDQFEQRNIESARLLATEPAPGAHIGAQCTCDAEVVACSLHCWPESTLEDVMKERDRYRDECKRLRRKIEEWREYADARREGRPVDDVPFG